MKLDPQKQVIALIENLIGQANVLTIPRCFIDYAGSLEGGLLLSQLLYWSPRSKNDGWVYKSYTEWDEEVALSKYLVMKATACLKNKGILETKTEWAEGSPTVHYRLEVVKFVQDIGKFLTMEYPKILEARAKIHRSKVKNLPMESKEFTNGKSNICQSITETTTETNPKTTKDIAPKAQMPNAHKSLVLSWMEYYEIDPSTVPKSENGKNYKLAQDLANAGCTSDQLKKFLAWQHNDPFWDGKTIRLEYVIQHFAGWLVTYRKNGGQYANTNRKPNPNYYRPNGRKPTPTRKAGDGLRSTEEIIADLERVGTENRQSGKDYLDSS